MRFLASILITAVLCLSGCGKKPPQSQETTNATASPCVGGQCPIPATAVDAPTVAPETPSAPAKPNGGTIPTLPHPDSQIPSQIIVPPPSGTKNTNK